MTTFIEVIMCGQDFPEVFNVSSIVSISQDEDGNAAIWMVDEPLDLEESYESLIARLASAGITTIRLPPAPEAKQ